MHRSAHLICDIVQAEKKKYFSPNTFKKYLTGEQLGVFILLICNIVNCRILVYDVEKCIGEGTNYEKV